jgi:hypothetical protein
MKIRTALAGAAALLLLAGPASTALAKQPHYSASYGQDRAQIEDLMSRYLFAIDYNDWDSYVETFTPDGELTFARGTSKGRPAIREMLIKFAATMATSYHTEDGKMAKLRHVVLQEVIRVEGHRAWGRTLWMEMANHGPGDTMKMGTYGIYEDEFKKENGQWLIAKRNVLNEFLKGRNSGPNNPVRDADTAADAFAASVKTAK